MYFINFFESENKLWSITTQYLFLTAFTLIPSSLFYNIVRNNILVFIPFILCL